ncbi:protein of unknown function [Magnetospira sp. QH-2]|nr:protein of unknown function [Magnetospira sp. QH-2]
MRGNNLRPVRRQASWTHGAPPEPRAGAPDAENDLSSLRDHLIDCNRVGRIQRVRWNPTRAKDKTLSVTPHSQPAIGFNRLLLL